MDRFTKMSGSTLEVFEDYQKARVKFVQRVAELATRPQKIEELQSAGVMQLLRPLLLDIVSLGLPTWRSFWKESYCVRKSLRPQYRCTHISCRPYTNKRTLIYCWRSSYVHRFPVFNSLPHSLLVASPITVMIWLRTLLPMKFCRNSYTH